MPEHDSPPPPFTPEAIRTGYNDAATQYAELFADALRDDPIERGLLAAFAELVRANGAAPVADVGCGPGHITAHLSSLGLAAFGVDLSPTMIELARAAHPELRFEVCSMDALDTLGVADASLGGLLSRYSIIHLPPDRLPTVTTEFARVLAPGAHLLLSFAATDPTQHNAPPDNHTPYDHAVTTAHRWRPDYISALLQAAGLVERTRTLTRPEPTAKRQFTSVQLLARKAEA